ncbi:MAG: tautomerase [Desulfuromonas sp.]|nr:MAG: tautomerase [Desulfuromonas sp.]
MPHLQFELNFTPSPEEKKQFAAKVVNNFATIMDTGTDHIGITYRCYDTNDLVFGRAEKPEDGIAFLNADIRLGRTREQKRQLALAIMSDLHATCGVPTASIYIIYTEHDGPHFQLDDRELPSWSEGEDPLE